MKFKRFWNWRFPLAGALAALALAVGVTIFLPQKSHTAALVARSEICAGCEITAREVQVRGLDPRAVPEKYLAAPQDVEGRKAAVALEAGTILQPSLLLENSMGDLREGEVAFALSIDDPAVAGFSQTGQTVEIWSSEPQTENQLLATGVRVLGVEASKDSLLGTSQSKAIVYLAANEESARKVVAAKDEHSLSFVLRG
ncbi:MAG: RcpC/CpaB family pilus assembly protein [Mobiluncus sp.]|uniref:RcpC/CpaB family pilus assembly protein n=1 Tax=Mobiluncus sp. TaxID=47293 RepID=UPI0025860E21|nr:RcpC/CpaB family pilus assembly protein [Mobiluncus sp.]MCI6585426.1 RcpC/CpaB family pilus assembly protein [Mobiluncus sp.]